MVLKYLGCDKKYFRYELYDGERLELYVETKLSARATAKLLFRNFGIEHIVLKIYNRTYGVKT
jgi:hypothetical protein